jgi:endo-1,4-beta-xylanase
MQRAGVKPFLAAAAVALTAFCPAVSGPAGEPTLGAAAASAGRYFGGALDPGAFDERPYRELAATQLTCITPENAMKWGNVEPLRGEFNWKGADALSPSPKPTGKKSGATRSSGTRSCRCG